jgi:hypothetical protein
MKKYYLMLGSHGTILGLYEWSPERFSGFMGLILELPSLKKLTLDNGLQTLETTVAKWVIKNSIEITASQFELFRHRFLRNETQLYFMGEPVTENHFSSRSFIDAINHSINNPLRIQIGIKPEKISKQIISSVDYSVLPDMTVLSKWKVYDTKPRLVTHWIDEFTPFVLNEGLKSQMEKQELPLPVDLDTFSVRNGFNSEPKKPSTKYCLFTGSDKIPFIGYSTWDEKRVSDALVQCIINGKKLVVRGEKNEVIAFLNSDETSKMSFKILKL